MIGTGASVSIVSIQTALKAQMRIVKTSTRLIMMNGIEDAIAGKAIGEVKIKGKFTKITFLVSKMRSCKIILGTD